MFPNLKKICLFVIAHDRPKILQLSLSSLIDNEIEKQIIILVDNPQLGVAGVISDFIKNNPSIDICCLTNPRIGGNTLSAIYQQIYNSECDIAGIIETDYVFRPQFLEEVIDVFAKFKSTLSIAGYNHPDTRNPKLSFVDFPNLTKKFFERDVSNRSLMYSPFVSIINQKQYLLQGISNHTGCHFLSGSVFRSIFENSLDKFLSLITDLASPVGFCDGRLSSTYQIYWEDWCIKNNIDIFKNFPILDICDYSIGNHYGGGGICVGGLDSEMVDWIKSPTWTDQHLIVERKKI